MNDLLQWINQTPWLNLLFIALSIAGIILSIVLYIRSQQNKLLCYSYVSSVLIGNSLSSTPELLIYYKDEPIESLASTSVIIWNAGRGTIDDIDVAPKDKIAIQFDPEIQVFDIDITNISDYANGFDLSKTSQHNRWCLLFDYIDYHDGICIRITHTSSSITPFILKGTLKGGKPIRHIPPYVDADLKPLLFDRYQKWLEKFEPSENLGFKYNLYWLVMFFVFALPYSIAGVPSTFMSFVRRTRNRPPKHLQSCLLP